MRRLVALLALVPAAAFAQSAAIIIHHEGRLFGADDVAVDAPQTISFALYTGETAETPKWTETYDVTVSKGLYRVALGETKGGKKALAVDDVAGERYLGIKIGSQELSPRLRLGTVASAASAMKADDAAKLGGVAAADYALKTDLAAAKTELTTAIAAAKTSVEGSVDAVEASVADLSDRLDTQVTALKDADKAFAKTSGTAFTGAVTVPAPSGATDAATKKYVDDTVAAATPVGFARLDGATFTGAVNVPAPTSDTSAATRKYTDDKVAAALSQAGVQTGTTRPSNPTTGKMFFNTNSGGFDIFDGSKWVAFGGTYASCKQILDAGASTGDGVYKIRPSSTMPAFDTFCDMTTDGGGWTMVGALVDGDVLRTGDSFEQRWARGPIGGSAWESLSTFGSLDTATKTSSGDYKNPAYFALEGNKNLLIYHTPNDTHVSQLRSSAYYVYRTTNDFLASNGGSLYKLYKNFLPIVRGPTNNGTRYPVTFDVGTATALWNEAMPNSKGESDPGFITFTPRNNEGSPMALCVFGIKGVNSEHTCVGGNGDTSGRGAGGWGDFREWGYDSNWGLNAKMRTTTMTLLVR